MNSTTRNNLSSITVLGAGSWGTALAIQLARSGRPVHLWGRETELIAKMRVERVNDVFLPDCPFPESLEVESDLDAALAGADDVLVVVPSHALRELLEKVAASGHPPSRLAWATKGFEARPRGGRRMPGRGADGRVVGPDVCPGGRPGHADRDHGRG